MNGTSRGVLFVCGMTAMQLFGCGPPRVSAPPSPKQAAPLGAGQATPFTATAYSGGSRTAAGDAPRAGIVAADPSVLPLGSRIRVSDAGAYSGEYVVNDTGGKVRGRKIDIYMTKSAHAKQFGRRKVKVQVVSYGPHRPRGHHVHRKRRHRANALRRR